jgi:GTP-binding protein
MEDQLEKGCTHYKNPKINYTSAKNFYKVDNIFDEVLNVYNSWNSRVTTNQLNLWVNQIRKVTNMPTEKGETLKIKFITQLKIRPPCFSVFVNNIDLFFKSHEAFLKKMLIREFRLRNVAIRFVVRDPENINERNKFKKVSVGTAKITKKINILKEKMQSPTYKKRMQGADFLYGSKSLFWGNRK